MRSVRALAPAMPLRGEMTREVRDAVAAQQRGYFLPDEDERLRELYTTYLSVRAALLETVDSIQPVLDALAREDDEESWELRLKAFLAGFTAATMLVRSAAFVVTLAGERPVVWKKLDEAEPRYGIPEKTFTKVYKNLTSTRRMWRFYEAMMFYDAHRDDLQHLAADATCFDLLEILREEEPFLQYRKRDYLKRRLSYRLHSFKRRHVSGYKKVMFHLLKLSGSTIAELKQPFVKARGQGKRVTGQVIEMIETLARPGDVFVTRHDDAVSNLFLPGFWPHAALYIGNEEQRTGLGMAGEGKSERDMAAIRFLEAKKDGVLFRPIAETLAVDAFMVLRPKIANGELVESLTRAMSHEGKLYDFVFDFRKADRLACTELIYRSYHGVGEIHFELRKHSGRSCISAEDLIEQALESGRFEKVADFGVEEDLVRVF